MYLVKSYRDADQAGIGYAGQFSSFTLFTPSTSTSKLGLFLVFLNGTVSIEGLFI